LQAILEPVPAVSFRPPSPCAEKLDLEDAAERQRVANMPRTFHRAK
jgi:hypothetical protein